MTEKKKFKPKIKAEVKSNNAINSNDLRSALDWKRLFNMIYSGVENAKYFDILYKLGIRDFLMSYHYVKSKKIGMSKYRDLGIKLFIDSGAYTYQNSEEYRDYTVERWEKQIVEYLQWARENKDVIFAIANLDLENLLGVDIVQEWNRIYFEPFMLETGIPVCFIWHPICGNKGWENYCQRYPYVGFSWVADDGMDLDLNFGSSMLKVAEKYNSLVHGMGMTRTALLPKLPFYTSDSTSWLVGLQYGELNYWNGRKMSRLKKDKWDEYKQRLVNKGIDFTKLKAEETEEMIKANVMAFIEAEKYIQERLKSRMYWLKSTAIKNDVSSDEVFDIFPPLNWLEGGEFENAGEYAKVLNINPDNGNDTINAIIDCSVFCNWDNENFKHFIEKVYLVEGVISQLHEVYINKVRADDEERIEDLKKFFWECVEGKNEKLLHLGTAFDRVVKERDSYIEEEDYSVIDLTEEEVKSRLGNILAAPKDSAPDISALDDVIFKEVNVVPVWDNNGKFVKGQQLVRRPKNIYSDKYPKLACSSCFVGTSCSEFKAGFACAYNKMFKRFDTRNMGDIIDAMQSMANLNLQRMQRVAIFETLQGGVPDGNLTSMIDQNMRLLMNMKQLYEHGSSEVLKHTKVIRADGTIEESTQVQNPSGGGILEKLFMQASKKEDAEKESNVDKDYIDADYSVED